MDIETGQEVVLTREWPLRPGSSLSLQPGDRGRVVRSTPTHVAMEIHGTVVVVAIDAVDVPGSPRRGSDDDPASGDDWFDGWASQMDKHRRPRRRPPED
jgi:hypothetical protein